MNGYRTRASRGVVGTAGLAGMCLLWWAVPAFAQFESGFEMPTYAGSPAGTDLNGQDTFYNPDPAASVTALVYTYAGNTLALPPNPNGGDQFVGATGPAGSIFARSQRDITYGNGTGVWTVTFDVAITFTGTLPSAQNVGSFSTQPLDPTTPANAGVIVLATWTAPATAANWNADYVYWDAANVQQIGPVADPAFQTLLVNHWYRWSTTFDLDTNRITEVSITDLTTGTTATNNPVEWYLSGGMAGGLAPPAGFRFFAGSSTAAGNTMCFDNLDISGPCPADVNGDGVVDVLDLLDVLSAWGPCPGCPEDINGDDVVDVLDLLELLSSWGPC